METAKGKDIAGLRGEEEPLDLFNIKLRCRFFFPAPCEK